MKDHFIAIIIVLLYFSPIFYQLVLVIREKKKGNRLPFKKFVKIAKYSFVILIPCVIGFAVISHTNYLNYEKPMTFDQYDEITFKNFRGLEFFKKSLYGNERFAYVNTTIESEIEGHSVTVQSLFHPSRSFVYNKQSFSEELLSHEKYHIKITELFTRKAKEKLSNLNTFDKDEIEGIIHNSRNKEREYQKEYDYDTFHSYVLSEQKRYEREVDSLLKKLTEFKEPKIIIDENN